MPKIIAEGGVAGHLAHLYDNRSLTFDKLAEILAAASKGELVGTEKTDGFNVYLGFKDGQPRAARNKGDMQRGGMSAVDLAMREFQGGPRIKKVYVDAFNAYEAAVNSLDDQEKAEIFGPDGEIFYNSEIMGPGASNVINYDADIITIHGAGHKRYDKELDRVLNVDTTDQSRALDSVIDKFEQATSDKKFDVQRTAVTKLKNLSGNYDLRIALERIKKAGFQGDMTIEQFLDERLLADVQEKFPSLDENSQQDIVDRSLKKSGAPDLTSIYRRVGKDKAIRAQVREYVKVSGKKISEIIWPIEDAIHDFAVAMLEGMESAYVLDNASELDRLKKEVSRAIRSIEAYEGPGDEVAHEILAKQLRKIKHLDNITSVAEGFVFEYDGQLYKFTGNFAPINQILGLFKFGRKGIKIPRVDENIEDRNIANKTIAIIPGAFKPPHRGHLDMVKHYAERADEVKVFISDPQNPDQKRYTPGGQEITPQDSLQVWNLYIDKAGLQGKVKVQISPNPSPVSTAYDYIDEIALPNEMIILGASTKGGDAAARFSGNLQKRADNKRPGENIKIIDPIKNAFDPVGEVLSATNFREDLDSVNNFEKINKYLPKEVNPEDVLRLLNIQSLEGEAEEVNEHVTLPIFFRMIEQVLDEIEPIQKKYKKKHATKRLSTKGKRVKSPPFSINPPKGRAKSAPPGFGGALEEEEIDELSSVSGGNVGGFAGNAFAPKKKKKKKKKKKPYMEPHMHQETGNTK